MSKIQKQNFNKEMELYRENLLKLLEQDEIWFVRRVEAVQAGNWERVREIEEKYLVPLKYKLNQLLERAPKDE